MSELSGACRQLFRLFQELGASTATVYLIDRFLRKLSPRLGLVFYDLIEQPVDGRPLLPAAHAATVRYVEVRPGAAELEAMPPPPQVKAQRFEQGAVCLAVYLKERYVGYVWFAFGQYDEDTVRCTYRLQRPEQSVFDFDFYVFPPYRMGRAFAAVWLAANRYLVARGVTRTCSRIARLNVASRRSHAQIGARAVGQALFLVLGPWQLSWSNRRRGISLHGGRRSPEIWF